jgi:hypothetical protein
VPARRIRKRPDTFEAGASAEHKRAKVKREPQAAAVEAVEAVGAVAAGRGRGGGGGARGKKRREHSSSGGRAPPPSGGGDSFSGTFIERH